MADLTQLAVALLGGEAQKKIAEENPYYQLAEVPAIVTKSIAGYQPQDASEMWKQSIAASVSNLLGGGLQAFGNRYQNTLSDRYEKALLQAIAGQTPSEEGLPPGIFGAAKQGGNVWNLISQAKGQEDAQDLIKAQAQREIDRQPLDDIGGEGASAAKIGGVEERLAKKTELLTRRFMRSGMTPSAAGDAANAIMRPEREELDRQNKRIEESSRYGNDLESLANAMQLHIQNLGYQGFGGGYAHLLAGARSLGSVDQNTKYSAGKELLSLASDVIALTGRVFKGPMSDRDVQIMLSKGPQLTNPKEANIGILNRWRAVAQLQKGYAEYMRAAQDTGISVKDAETAWDRLRSANPYVIVKDGEYEINPVWLSGKLPETMQSPGGGAAPVEAAAAQPAAESRDNPPPPMAGKRRFWNGKSWEYK